MSKVLNWLPLTLLVLFLFGGSCYKLGKIRADRWYAQHQKVLKQGEWIRAHPEGSARIQFGKGQDWEGSVNVTCWTPDK